MPTHRPLFTAQNRAFNYGDGLFETLRIINGEIPYLSYHFDRLKNGLDILEIEYNNPFTQKQFHSEILKLTGKKNCRVRFTAFRPDGGLYAPVNNKLQFLITAKKLRHQSFQCTDNGINIELFNGIELAYNKLSPLKTINALPYILAAKHRSTTDADEVILLNTAGRVVEGTSSNLFIWNGKHLITPPLDEAGVAGVIRAILLNRSKRFDLKIKEGKITIKQLRKAKAVFLTNSIQGVKWVRHFQGKKYKKKEAKGIGKLLLEILKTS